MNKLKFAELEKLLEIFFMKNVEGSFIYLKSNRFHPYYIVRFSKFSRRYNFSVRPCIKNQE